jgi:hypothetical protein
MMSVFEAVEQELEELGVTGSALAATALSLAEGLDAPNSLTSKSMAAKALADVLKEIRSLAPPAEQEDEIERARKRRAKRLAGKSAAGASPSS